MHIKAESMPTQGRETQRHQTMISANINIFIPQSYKTSKNKVTIYLAVLKTCATRYASFFSSC